MEMGVYKDTILSDKLGRIVIPIKVREKLEIDGHKGVFNFKFDELTGVITLVPIGKTNLK